MIRRTILKSILPASIGSTMGHFNHNSKAIERPNDPPVEGGVEPMPNFPFLIVSKMSNLVTKRLILVIADAESFHNFEPTITDQAIKELYYRNAEFIDLVGHPYKMAPYGNVTTNSDGSVSWKAPKGQSGEDMTVTF